MKGLIFSIKRYSIYDGPGIRVTVFMKGCPLSCWWCHNPEGISPEQEELTEVYKIGDKEFVKKRMAGQYYTTEDILKVLEKERVFIERSGGGITFSGGEPFMQPEFLAEALRECRKSGYHTAIDTSGYFQSEILKQVLPHTNLFLFDIKHLDPVKHLEYTGVSNIMILQNLSKIIKSGNDIMLRIPILPGINDDVVHLNALRDYISGLNSGSIKMINLLPYHRIGSSKYRKLGRDDRMKSFNPPSSERMKELKKFFSSTGIKVKIGG